MLDATADVAVVGDGIAGLTVALACAERGLRVAICAGQRPGAASPASAGILGASVGGRADDDPVQRFMIAARDAWPAFLARLGDRTGITVPMMRGAIELPESNAAFDAAERRPRPGSRLLSARELAELEPALPAGWAGILHPDDGAVEVPTLLAALGAAIAASPDRRPRIARCAGATALHAHGARAAQLDLDDGSRLSAARVVVAAGPWAASLPGIPRPLPVVAVKGQVAFADATPVAHVVFGAGGYIVPRGGELLVGATSEDAGFDASTTASARRVLAAIADTLLPAGAPWEPRFTRQLAGLRPMTPDLLPILGPDPAEPSVVYACGYSRNGILIAPLAAECIADTLTGNTPRASLGAFSVARF